MVVVTRRISCGTAPHRGVENVTWGSSVSGASGWSKISGFVDDSAHVVGLVNWMAMTMPARTIATAMIATMILLRGLRAPSRCSVVGGAPSDGPDWPANRSPPRGPSQVRHITLCGSMGPMDDLAETVV